MARMSSAKRWPGTPGCSSAFAPSWSGRLAVSDPSAPLARSARCPFNLTASRPKTDPLPGTLRHVAGIGFPSPLVRVTVGVGPPSIPRAARITNQVKRTRSWGVGAAPRRACAIPVSMRWRTPTLAGAWPRVASVRAIRAASGLCDPSLDALAHSDASWGVAPRGVCPCDPRLDALAHSHAQLGGWPRVASGPSDGGDVPPSIRPAARIPTVAWTTRRKS
jgi:hypothetical protein